MADKRNTRLLELPPRLSLSLCVCVCFLAQAHMADEWVLVADLIKMDAVLEEWLTTP